MKVLVIEDDSVLNQNIKEALLADNISVESVFDGNLAERMLKDEFDCVIMDINLPGKTGFELCRNFRNYNTHTPVIMLTAFGELEDKIKGFDCGADDYLTKPFYMRELLLRVHSMMKRTQHNNGTKLNQPLVAGDIAIHPAKKKVYHEDKEVMLTPREYQILVKLVKNAGEIISKDQLLKEIWGSSMGLNTNTIEVYINFLRNKIDKPFGKETIKTKVGYGYYLDTE